MDERILLLLGMLKAERLCAQGDVERTIEQKGNRPPRKVYQLREAGEERFFTALRTLLSQASIGTPPFEIALVFLDDLAEPEVHALLQSMCCS